MPIYEYACQECGHQFEQLQRMSDDPIQDCPQCSKIECVRKLVSQSSFVLKGGGWYSDHYGLKSGQDKSGGGSGDSSADSITKPSATSTSTSTAKSSTPKATGD